MRAALMVMALLAQAYVAVHLDSDMEFGKAVQAQVTARTASVDGDHAWVATTGAAAASFAARTSTR